MKVEDVRNVTVAGGGTQGSQIASQIAYKGYNVTVWVRSEESIARALPRFEMVRGQYLDALEQMKSGDEDAYCRGLSNERDLTPEQIDELKVQAAERLDGINFVVDYDIAFGNADVVVECINENPAEKTAFYTELAGHLPERTVLLTDSSTMLPSMFADATGGRTASCRSTLPTRSGATTSPSSCVRAARATRPLSWRRTLPRRLA